MGLDLPQSLTLKIYSIMKKYWILLTAVFLIAIGLILALSNNGVFAAGNFVMNYFSSGSYSLGYFSSGLFSAGIFSAGIFSAGIFSIGIFSIGIFSLGIFNIGWFIIGIFLLGKRKKKIEADYVSA